ncbi:MAG: hypothetical protein RL105_1725 [Verrucomicrobiota bacterium]|jgi:hypothetical protein
MSPFIPSYDDLMRPTRRHFLGTSALGMGALALRHLTPEAAAAEKAARTHFPAKAKRVIYLFQAGGPSQFETLDPKPLLREKHGQDLPDSVRKGQRLTGMSGNQSRLPLAGSFTEFKKYGRSGVEYSDIMSETGAMADDICVIRSMHTEAINHDPGITFFCSGSQIAGRPSMGAWASYGLGSMNENLPAFIVLVSQDATKDQPLYSRLWGSGFLPSEHQGVQFKAGKEPVLFLTNPEGVSPHARRGMLDALGKLNGVQRANELDPEVDARLAQAEMAYRMQTSVPEVTDISGESKETLEMYGESVNQPGSFAANCLLARRLIEKGVRFVNLFHQGWDNHGGLPGGIRRQCKQTDKPAAALLKDLKRRGLLEDTLVVWGGEFGRTAYCQGKMTKDNYGRDHHPRCFSMWMAGGGVKGGHVHGATDDFGYNIASDGVHVHDLHATMLHLMGVNHERLTFKFQGRYYRLTDVHGHVVKPVLA